jgi:hypothetical protein
MCNLYGFPLFVSITVSVVFDSSKGGLVILILGKHSRDVGSSHPMHETLELEPDVLELDELLADELEDSMLELEESMLELEESMLELEESMLELEELLDEDLSSTQ